MPGPKSWQISRALLNIHRCGYSITRTILDVKLVGLCRTDRKGKDGYNKLAQVEHRPEMARNALQTPLALALCHFPCP